MGEFSVEHHDFAPGPEPEEGQPQPDGQQPQQPLEGVVMDPAWSAEAAEQMLTACWNMGCLFYGAEWAAQQGEFATWRDAAANLLNRYVPYGEGGGGSTVVDIVRCAGGLSIAVGRRREVIKRGPIIFRKEGEKAEKKPAPEQPAQPGQATPAESAPNGGFRFSDDDIKILGQSYAGHGYGEAA